MLASGTDPTTLGQLAEVFEEPPSITQRAGVRPLNQKHKKQQGADLAGVNEKQSDGSSDT